MGRGRRVRGGGRPRRSRAVSRPAPSGVSSPRSRRSTRFPFEASRKRATVVVREGDAAVSVVKGAPEVVLARCVADPAERERLQARRRAMGGRGSARARRRLAERRSGRDVRGDARVEPATARPRRPHRSAAPQGGRFGPGRARARPRREDAHRRPRAHRGRDRPRARPRPDGGRRAVHPCRQARARRRPCNGTARSSPSPATGSTTRPRCARRTSASRWARPAPRPRGRRPRSCSPTTTSRRSSRPWRRAGGSPGNLRSFLAFLLSANVGEVRALRRRDRRRARPTDDGRPGARGEPAHRRAAGDRPRPRPGGSHARPEHGKLLRPGLRRRHSS